jgi:dCTP deaminase
MVRPERFPIRLAPGIALSQMRLFDGASFLDPLEMDFAIEKPGLLFEADGTRIAKPVRHADSMLLSVRVGETMGWECRGTNEVLDLARKGVDASGFFEPVSMRRGAFDLRKGSAYILATRERVMVPPHCSAELRAIDPRFGDLRVHLAGYIDSGWGWGRGGEGHGRPITLEVMPHENLRLWSGQYIGKIRYEHMKEAPDVPYDAAERSNYNAPEVCAGPTLAKFFKLAA